VRKKVRFLLDLLILQSVRFGLREKPKAISTFDSAPVYCLLDFCLVLRGVGLLFLLSKLEIAWIWQMISFLCYMLRYFFVTKSVRNPTR